MSGDQLEENSEGSDDTLVEKSPPLVLSEPIVRKEENEPKPTAVADWSRLDAKTLQRIFQMITVSDVYFCRYMCRNWYLTAKEFFCTVDKLDWHQVTHNRSIDASVRYRARLCLTCWRVALFHMPNLTVLNFSFPLDTRLVCISNTDPDTEMLQDIVQNLLDGIKEVRFAALNPVNDIVMYLLKVGPETMKIKVGDKWVNKWI